jgi:hypothetical protein
MRYTDPENEDRVIDAERVPLLARVEDQLPTAQ